MPVPRLPFVFLSLFPAVAVHADGTALDRLAVYAGTWQGRYEHFATPYSKAGRDTTLLHNDCWRAHRFYACEQVVDGKPVALVVFLPAAAPDRYITDAIPADGGHPNSGTLVVAGDRWVFPWQFQDHGRTVHARVVNVFHGRDRIDYRQEYSLDQVHWTPMAAGEEVRRP